MRNIARLFSLDIALYLIGSRKGVMRRLHETIGARSFLRASRSPDEKDDPEPNQDPGKHHDTPNEQFHSGRARYQLSAPAALRML